MIHIQILRGFAAVSVVIFHCIGNVRHYTGEEEHWLLQLFRHGGSGVDLFFVISGFIIYHSTHRSDASRSQFLSRRLKRIVPIYWIFTAVFLLAVFAFPSIATKASDVTGLRGLESLLFLTFASGTPPIIYVGWSLEFEVFFYLVVALLLQRSERMWSDIVYLFSALAILHFLPAVKTLTPVHGFFTNPRILEFCYGILAAQLFARRAPIGPVAVAAAATLAVVILDESSELVVTGLPSALLVYLAARWSARDRCPSGLERIGAHIGDASYSIYLVQVFVIAAVFKTFGRLHPPIDVLILAEAGLSILAGYMIFRLLEKPLLAAMKKA